MRSSQSLLAVLCTLLLATCALSDEKPCTIHDNGKFYDLNPLKSRKDYEMKTPTGRTLFLNVCQGVKTETVGLKDDIDASEVGGFVRRGHADFSIGNFNTSLSIFDSSPRFVLSGGSRCISTRSQPGDIRASSVVGFVCDTSVSGFGTPRLLAALPPGDEEAACAFIIEWKTPYACATFEGGAFWRFITTLAVIGLVLLMTYTILGTLYNRFVLNLRGYDQIPQFSFESMKYHGKEAFEWTKDMAGIIAVDLCSRISTINGHMSSGNNPRTPNPVSHQAQVFSANVNDDIEQGKQQQQGGDDSIVRPQKSKTALTSLQTSRINPVSHQSQSSQSLSFAAEPSQPTPLKMVDLPTAPKVDLLDSTEEEDEFILGGDTEDVRDDEITTATPSTERTRAAVVPQSTAAASSEIVESATVAGPPKREKDAT